MRRWKQFSAIVSAACLLLALAIPVLAGTTHTEAFAGSYTLTGDGAWDMVSIALAQEGRSGRDFGYSDQWCAFFISDCARIAGQTAAIPPQGSCTYLYQSILNAGGTVTTADPRPGDICFINWDGGSRMSHVELVYQVEGDRVYTIGGNSGGGDSYQSRVVKKHAPLSSECIVQILRPAYGASAPETQPPETLPPETQPPTEPQPETYTVRYHANGGENAPKKQTKTQDVSLRLSQQLPQREGWIFGGWQTEDGNRYVPGDLFERNADTTLYACWESADSPTVPKIPADMLPFVRQWIWGCCAAQTINRDSGPLTDQ